MDDLVTFRKSRDQGTKECQQPSIRIVPLVVFGCHCIPSRERENLSQFGEVRKIIDSKVLAGKRGYVSSLEGVYIYMLVTKSKSSYESSLITMLDGSRHNQFIYFHECDHLLNIPGILLCFLQ